MTDKTSLGDRMKGYEHVSRAHLTPRVPVILRFDGRAFHTFTRGMERPWDPRMTFSMAGAAHALVQEIQGAKLAYVQSDEISVLVTDFDTITTQGWFGYNVQKMVSVGSSLCSIEYIKSMRELEDPHLPYWPQFDGRAFTVPEAEVTNYFIWRQKDATRNSVQMLGRAHFSHRELHGKSTSDIQDMLMEQYGVNWNDVATSAKRGFCLVRQQYEVQQSREPEIEASLEPVYRSKWAADWEIPIFTGDRNYIDSRLRTVPDSLSTSLSGESGQ